MIEYISKQIMT